MRISEYELLESSTGSGYIDDPYVFYNLYVRGDSSVKWTILGQGKFAINLADISQEVYAEDTAYHAISVYVNGVLARVDNSLLTETDNFGLTIDLTKSVSEVELVFSSNLSSEDNLTSVGKMSSFLIQEKPATPTTTVEPPVVETELVSKDLIKSTGIKVADVDFTSVCGPNRIEISPDTGEFHFLDNEVWFTGGRSTERGYLVTIKAFDNNDVLITSKSLEFSLVTCHSSNDCVLDENNNPTRPDGSSGSNSGGSSLDPNVSEDISPPTRLSVVIGDCGPRAGQAQDDATVWSYVTFNWSTEGDDVPCDFQVSRGNLFNITEHSETSMIGDTIDVLLVPSTTYFFRVRAKSSESSKYSEWSESKKFTTTHPFSCIDTALPIPGTPERVPVLCEEGIPPSGPTEPEVTPPGPGSAPTDPESPDEPEAPTPPGGPGGCVGSGCGDDDDPNNPNNPNGPNYPNPPGGNPPVPPSGPTGGCIGPGCDPGSGPGGDNPGPGGETDPSPLPPQVPPPPKPVCTDGKLHSSYVNIENKGDGTIIATALWDARPNGCAEYLSSIGQTDSDEIASVSVTSGASALLNLKAACPECVEICVTGDDVPFEYVMWTLPYGDDGQPESPYIHSSSSEISKPSCGCDGLSIADVYPVESINDAGSVGGLNVANLAVEASIKVALLREPDINNGEACFQFFNTIAFANGDEQERTKVACYRCDGRSFINITNEIIACEVGLFRRFQKPGQNSQFVSFQNHWEMSDLTHEFAENTWPDTNLAGYIVEGQPFRSNGGWKVESPLCVTCCQTETMPNGSPSIISHDPKAGNRGVGLTSPTYPWNNINCLAGQEVDKNFNGQTGNWNGSDETTTIGACHPLFVSSTTIDDALNSVADGLYGSTTQVGFAQTTQDAIDNKPPNQFATGGDFAYMLTYDNNFSECQYQGADNVQYYGLQAGSYAVQVEISCHALLGFSSDCSHLSSTKLDVTLEGVGIYPGTTENSSANGNTWHEDGFNWDADDIGTDGRPLSPTRWTVTITQEPFGGANPLP